MASRPTEQPGQQLHCQDDLLKLVQQVRRPPRAAPRLHCITSCFFSSKGEKCGSPWGVTPHARELRDAAGHDAVAGLA
jgi:hypothetical protein